MIVANIQVSRVDVDPLRDQRNHMLDIIGGYESDINSSSVHKEALQGVVNMLDEIIDVAEGYPALPK